MTPNQLKVLAAHDLVKLIPSEEIAYRTGLTNAQVRAARAVLASQGLIVVHTRRDEIGRVRGKGYVLTDEGVKWAQLDRALPISHNLPLWKRLLRAFGRAVA